MVRKRVSLEDLASSTSEVVLVDEQAIDQSLSDDGGLEQSTKLIDESSESIESGLSDVDLLDNAVGIATESQTSDSIKMLALICDNVKSRHGFSGKQLSLESDNGETIIAKVKKFIVAFYEAIKTGLKKIAAWLAEFFGKLSGKEKELGTTVDAQVEVVSNLEAKTRKIGLSPEKIQTAVAAWTGNNSDFIEEIKSAKSPEEVKQLVHQKVLSLGYSGSDDVVDVEPTGTKTLGYERTKALGYEKPDASKALEAEIKKLNGKLEDTQKKKDVIEDHLNKLTARFEQTAAGLDASNDRRKILEADINELKAKLASIEAQEKQHISQIDQLNSKLESSQKALDDESAAHAGTQSRLDEAQSKNATLGKTNTLLEKKLVSAMSKNRLLVSALLSLQSKGKFSIGTAQDHPDMSKALMDDKGELPTPEQFESFVKARSNNSSFTMVKNFFHSKLAANWMRGYLEDSSDINKFVGSYLNDKQASQANDEKDLQDFLKACEIPYKGQPVEKELDGFRLSEPQKVKADGNTYILEFGLGNAKAQSSVQDQEIFALSLDQAKNGLASVSAFLKQTKDVMEHANAQLKEMGEMIEKDMAHRKSEADKINRGALMEGKDRMALETACMVYVRRSSRAAKVHMAISRFVANVGREKAEFEQALMMWASQSMKIHSEVINALS